MMKNKKLISAILAAASIAGGVVGAQAETLDSLTARVDKQDIKIVDLQTTVGIGTSLTNGAGDLSAGVNENTKAIKTKADAWETTKNFANVQEQLDTQDNKNKAQDVSIKAHADAIKANKGAIKNEATTRENEDKKLQANIINEAKARENAVNALNSRIGQVESDANKGIAKASALAALRPLEYDPDNKFDISAAGGFYKGENAFALGAFYRPNRNVMLSMGTTLTSGDNAYNVGLSFKIGKSGKHTETGLTTADLYAMIGAMQDKMDQQQKKIEELEAKQAK